MIMENLLAVTRIAVDTSIPPEESITTVTISVYYKYVVDGSNGSKVVDVPAATAFNLVNVCMKLLLHGAIMSHDAMCLLLDAIVDMAN